MSKVLQGNVTQNVYKGKQCKKIAKQTKKLGKGFDKHAWREIKRISIKKVKKLRSLTKVSRIKKTEKIHINELHTLTGDIWKCCWNFDFLENETNEKN